MNTNRNKTTKIQASKRVTTEAEILVKARHIKLGIDVHLDRYVVVRILDGGTPQPPQRFGPPEFLLRVAKQITLAEQVFTCYEAGLHRQLEKLKAVNDVVRPRQLGRV